MTSAEVTSAVTIVMNVIANTITTLATVRPSASFGTTSPYPTVQNVTTAHQTPIPTVGNASSSILCMRKPATALKPSVMPAR